MKSTVENFYRFQLHCFSWLANAGSAALVAIHSIDSGWHCRYLVVIHLCVLGFFGKHLDEPGTKAKGNFSSLQGVIDLFKSPRSVLAGWVHYLAFDLFIGVFIVANAAHYNISYWLVLPCLALTLMLGPAGLLLYFVIRFAINQDLSAINFF